MASPGLSLLRTLPVAGAEGTAARKCQEFIARRPSRRAAHHRLRATGTLLGAPARTVQASASSSSSPSSSSPSSTSGAPAGQQQQQQQQRAPQPPKKMSIGDMLRGVLHPDTQRLHDQHSVQQQQQRRRQQQQQQDAHPDGSTTDAGSGGRAGSSSSSSGGTSSSSPLLVVDSSNVTSHTSSTAPAAAKPEAAAAAGAAAAAVGTAKRRGARAADLFAVTSPEAAVAAAAYEKAIARNRLVTVRFRLALRAEDGQRVKVVGSHKSLGKWGLAKAPELESCEGDMWQTTVALPAGSVGEYKYVLLDRTGNYIVEWQQGCNSILALRMDDESLELADTWGCGEYAAGGGAAPGAGANGGAGALVVRESRLMAWVGDVFSQLAAQRQEVKAAKALLTVQRQEVRRVRMELAGAQEEARVARDAAQHFQVQAARQEVELLESTMRYTQACTLNDALQSQLTDTTASLKEAVETAVGLMQQMDSGDSYDSSGSSGSESDDGAAPTPTAAVVTVAAAVPAAAAAAAAGLVSMDAGNGAAIAATHAEGSAAEAAAPPPRKRRAGGGRKPAAGKAAKAAVQPVAEPGAA